MYTQTNTRDSHDLPLSAGALQKTRKTFGASHRSHYIISAGYCRLMNTLPAAQLTLLSMRTKNFDVTVVFIMGFVCFAMVQIYFIKNNKNLPSPITSSSVNKKNDKFHLIFKAILCSQSKQRNFQV